MGEEVRHIKRFQDGRVTAREYHAENAFPPGSKCHGCDRRPMVRAITMAPFKDAVAAFPYIRLATPEQIGKILVSLQQSSAHRPEPYLRLGIAYSCDSCRPSFEKTLAKLPSWVVVDIQRGPEERRIIVNG